MDSRSCKRSSTSENGNQAPYISKEKYSALAEDIKSWEDDVRHITSNSARPLLPIPCTTYKVDRHRIRESLATLQPAYVSSLRQFWEGMMSSDPPVSASKSHLTVKDIENAAPIVVKTTTTKYNGTNSMESKIVADFPLPPVPHDSIAVTPSTAMFLCETHTNLPPPPSPTLERKLPAPPISNNDSNMINRTLFSKSDDFMVMTKSHNQFESPECQGTSSMTHNYYNRPKPGALRNWPIEGNLTTAKTASPQKTNVLTELPRQRSVTFEPKAGSAPGDTEVETDGIYEPLSQGSDSADMMHTPRAPTVFSVSADVSPPHIDTNHNVDGYTHQCDTDSFSAMEAAAKLVNFIDSDTPSDGNEPNKNYSSDDDVIYMSDPGEPSSASLDTNNPCYPVACVSHHLRHQRIRGNIRRQSSSTSFISRRSTSRNNRRISREASALLDLDCPPTPLPGNRISKSALELAAIAETANQRRVARKDEITRLLEEEKTRIFEMSAVLADFHKKTVNIGQLKTSSSSSKALKSYRTTQPSSANCLTEKEAETYLDLSQQFLIVCQQRQSLVEELTLLLKGSPVLLPPRKGEPLRARFKLASIRLALKSEAPYTKMGIPGGFTVIGYGNSTANITFDTPSPIDGRKPVKYHILAVLKCVGEGRVYHTQTATLMRIADLPVGSARAASFVDLPADIDIVPLRPDFLIAIEVYCMKIDEQDSVDESELTSSSPLHHSESASKRCGLRLPFTLFSVHSSRKKLPCSRDTKANFNQRNNNTSMTTAAFTLLSSVSLRHSDDLLFGRLPVPARSNSMVTNKTAPTGMPLYLENLPRSCPLSGPLGLNQASVVLQSAVLKRGFLTVFDESGGMGVWQRRWCKLLADKIVFWRYPEDEENGESMGCIDLRHIVTPWAVAAPRKICARSNAVFMRSLVAVSPKWLSSERGSSEGGLSNVSITATSLLFNASSDYRWLEQKHLICADTLAEREVWIALVNKSLSILQSWMPEHFSCLQRYDSKLAFNRPVSTKVAASLKQNQYERAFDCDSDKI